MPELPEVETVRRGLSRVLVGRRIERCQVRQPKLRWPVEQRALEALVVGATVRQIRRRAKYLLLDLASHEGTDGPAGGTPRGSLVVHLGMTGWMGLRPLTPVRTHDHVLFGLDDGQVLCFNDARRFGSVHALPLGQEHSFRLFASLGVEPLEAAAFDGAYLYARCRGRTQALKERLMDSQLVVGVGNIYASEALFRAGVHPLLPAGRLSRPRAARVAAAVRETLLDAIEQGGTTLRDFLGADGLKGMFAPRLRVYGKEGAPCPRRRAAARCPGTVRRTVLGGRSTYYCPRCQSR